jgi:hypothetical protein
LPLSGKREQAPRSLHGLPRQIFAKMRLNRDLAVLTGASAQAFTHKAVLTGLALAAVSGLAVAQWAA